MSCTLENVKLIITQPNDFFISHNLASTWHVKLCKIHQLEPLLQPREQTYQNDPKDYNVLHLRTTHLHINSNNNGNHHIIIKI